MNLPGGWVGMFQSSILWGTLQAQMPLQHLEGEQPPHPPLGMHTTLPVAESPPFKGAGVRGRKLKKTPELLHLPGLFNRSNLKAEESARGRMFFRSPEPPKQGRQGFHPGQRISLQHPLRGFLSAPPPPHLSPLPKQSENGPNTNYTEESHANIFVFGCLSHFSFFAWCLF